MVISLNKMLPCYQNVTSNVTSKNPYNTIFFNNSNKVTYIHDTPIGNSYVFHDLFRGGICRKKCYFVTFVKNALKYGFRKKRYGNIRKCYLTLPFADIGKYGFGIFIQNVTFYWNVTKAVIFRGDNNYWQ